MSNQIETTDPEEVAFFAQATAIKRAIGPAIPDGTSLSMVAFVATDLLCHSIIHTGHPDVQRSMLESARASLDALEADLDDPAKAATIAASAPGSSTLQ